MPTKVFTDRWLKSVKTDKVQEEYSDSSFNETGALILVVSRTGKKTFFHRYRVNGKKKRDLLGSYPSLSLVGAREKAIDNVSKLNEGDDPALLKQNYRDAETFGDLAKLFLERAEGRLAPSTLKNYWKMYECDLKKWEDRKARDIRKADVIQVLEHICFEREAPTKSNRTYELISRIFNFGISREIVERNPVHGLEKLGEEKRGERVLTQEEIKYFWTATERQRPHIRAIFRLLLLTGQRPIEIQSIEWEYIDNDILTIPAAISKNRRRHQIHLGKLALKEIELMRNSS